MNMEYTENFELFWKHYHLLTGNRQLTKAPCFKYWKRLSLPEKREAYRMVWWYKHFQQHLYGKKCYYHKARTYLSERIFEEIELLKYKEDVENYRKTGISKEKKVTDRIMFKRKKYE